MLLDTNSFGCYLDIWSAGCVVVELLTNNPLFPACEASEHLMRVLNLLPFPKSNDIIDFLKPYYKSLYDRDLNDYKQLIITSCNWDSILGCRRLPDIMEVVDASVTYPPGRRLNACDILSLPLFKCADSLSPQTVLPLSSIPDGKRHVPPASSAAVT